MPKYDKYQDYVIKDGKLIGEFDQMYKEYSDPWEQSAKVVGKTINEIAVMLLKRINAKRVIELGCGLGHFTNMINVAGINVTGLDISATAISQAKINFHNIQFQVADILDFQVYEKIEPDVIVMSEITWYILDKLDLFVEHLKKEMPSVYLLHLLSTYPKGIQKYGNEKFSNLREILEYFDMNYLEYGETGKDNYESEKNTYFIGTFQALD